MKKILTPLLMTLLLFLVAVPKVDAIITDPNDYIIYDSGIMADSVHCSTWEFPSFMTITDSVSVKKVNKWGRHNNSVVDYGYPPKTDVATLKGKVDLWGIVIGQKKRLQWHQLHCLFGTTGRRKASFLCEQMEGRLALWTSHRLYCYPYSHYQ